MSLNPVIDPWSHPDGGCLGLHDLGKLLPGLPLGGCVAPCTLAGGEGLYARPAACLVNQVDRLQCGVQDLGFIWGSPVFRVWDGGVCPRIQGLGWRGVPQVRLVTQGAGDIDAWREPHVCDTCRSPTCAVMSSVYAICTTVVMAG